MLLALAVSAGIISHPAYAVKSVIDGVHVTADIRMDHVAADGHYVEPAAWIPAVLPGYSRCFRTHTCVCPSKLIPRYPRNSISVPVPIRRHVQE